MYDRPATSRTPALIIYLIDASGSMNELCEADTKIEVVNQVLKTTIETMVHRSTQPEGLQNCYKLAILAYGSKMLDVLGGIRPLAEVMQLGDPKLFAGGVTDMAKGFEGVATLLRDHLEEYQDSPAPLVCHLTDAGYTTDDPLPVIRSIQAMRVKDGQVLVEHVYIADGMLRTPVHNWQQWPGLLRAKDLNDPYARYLFSLSSPLPETYRQNMNNVWKYNLRPGARLFFPGKQYKLLQFAFATPTAINMR